MLASPALILLFAAPQAGLATAPATGPDSLQVSTDLAYKTVNAGDTLHFSTVVTNTGTRPTPAMSVAMNIIKTGQGDPVDPEDWSPERTQQLAALAPGASAKQSWTVDAVLEGDYMVYLTAIPKPSGADATSKPVSSPGIHLTVKAFTESNPGGVLPVAIAMPLGLGLIALIPRWRRRRRVDEPAVEP